MSTLKTALACAAGWAQDWLNAFKNYMKLASEKVEGKEDYLPPIKPKRYVEEMAMELPFHEVHHNKVVYLIKKHPEYPKIRKAWKERYGIDLWQD